MSRDLILRDEYKKPATQQPLAQGEVQGVFFTISPDMPYEQLLAKIEASFQKFEAGRSGWAMVPPNEGSHKDADESLVG